MDNSVAVMSESGAKGHVNPMKACPKYDRCSAPICPLDPDWRKRVHLSSGDRVCAWLLELFKPAGEERLRGYLADATASAIVQVAPLIHQHGGATVKKVLDRACQTGSNLEKRQKMAEKNFRR